MPPAVPAALSSTQVGYFAAVATVLPVLLVAYAVQVNGLLRLSLKWRLTGPVDQPSDPEEITDALAGMIVLSITRYTDTVGRAVDAALAYKAVREAVESSEWPRRLAAVYPRLARPLRRGTGALFVVAGLIGISLPAAARDHGFLPTSDHENFPGR